MLSNLIMRNFITQENLKAAQSFITRQATAGKDAVLQGVASIAPAAISAKNTVVEGMESAGTQVLHGTEFLAKSTKKLAQEITEKVEPECLAYEFDRLALLRQLETAGYSPKYEDVIFDKIVFISPFEHSKQGYQDGFLYSFDESVEEWQQKIHTAKIVGYANGGDIEVLVVAVNGSTKRPKFTYVDAKGKIKVLNNSGEMFYIILSKVAGTSSKKVSEILEKSLEEIAGIEFEVKGQLR